MKRTRLIHSGEEPLFTVFGPLHQFLVQPADTSGAFALMRIVVPPGVAIPLHSHADPEVFFIVEGRLDVFAYNGGPGDWMIAVSGDVISIPSNVKHAIRNSSPSPTALLLATTPAIHAFFEELAVPFDPEWPGGPPTRDGMQHLQTLAAKYGYWIAAPQEIEAIGPVMKSEGADAFACTLDPR
jgi:quercetin dioxygenase-like cupin family protein